MDLSVSVLTGFDCMSFSPLGILEQKITNSLSITPLFVRELHVIQLYLLATIFLHPTSTTGLQLSFFDLPNARPVATPSRFLYIDK